MAQGHRPSRRGVPGGGQAGPAYLAARLGSEPSSLFGFVSLCPNSSDGLDKMFLTAYEMDSWPPPGARRVARADREAELSLQGGGIQGQHAPQLPASAPLACQHLSRAFRSRVNCPLVTGPGRASLADSCFSFSLEEKPSPGGCRLGGKAEAGLGAPPGGTLPLHTLVAGAAFCGPWEGAWVWG